LLWRDEEEDDADRKLPNGYIDKGLKKTKKKKVTELYQVRTLVARCLLLQRWRRVTTNAARFDRFTLVAPPPT
jgi:hypothetical protein